MAYNQIKSNHLTHCLWFMRAIPVTLALLLYVMTIWAHRIKRQFRRIPNPNRALFDPVEALIRCGYAVVKFWCSLPLDENAKPPRLGGRRASTGLL